MKYIISLLVAFVPGLTIAQSKMQFKKHSWDYMTKKQERREERNHDCICTNRYSVAELRKIYPFDIANSVSIVSFDNGSDSTFSRLPITMGEIDYSQIEESKVLNREQTDSLSGLFYNVTYRGKITRSWGTGCYQPRNAVLFFDANNHLLEYIEICFECHEQQFSSERVNIGDRCNDKSELIRAFFFAQGIRVGTEKRLNDQ